MHIYTYTHIYIYICVCVCARARACIHECRRKEMFYLTTHTTHFLTVIWRRTYGKRPLSQTGNPLPLQGLLFTVGSKEYFKCTIPQTETYSRGALAGTYTH